MQHINNLVRLMKSNGFPRGFVDQNYMTTHEAVAFNSACEQHGVLSSLQLSERANADHAARTAKALGQ